MKCGHDWKYLRMLYVKNFGHIALFHCELCTRVGRPEAKDPKGIK